MQQPKLETLEDQICWDLQRKLSDDIEGVIRRSLALSPDPMAMMLQAASTAVTIFAAGLQHNQTDLKHLDLDRLKMFAALMVGRVIITGEASDAYGEAIKDFAALGAARRMRP